MNNTFRGFRFGYNNFKVGFKPSQSNFSRSFFQSKYILNLLRMNIGNNFKINFSNKNFMSKVLEMNNGQQLAILLGGSYRLIGISGSTENVSDTEVGLSCLETKIGQALYELSLMLDDCKWMPCAVLACGTIPPTNI
jgi:hypothetical protein